ncbi:hypothetical protein LINGRAHAP2_LOCUS16872 [Linum grandiflorum]
MYRTVRIRGRNSSKENEAFAVWEGLKWCVDLELDHVIIESDAQVVVNAIGGEGVEDRLEFGDIIRRCRSILLSKPEFKVCFVRRDSNQVAHVLGQQSKLLASPTVEESAPYFLCNSLNDICRILHD